MEANEGNKFCQPTKFAWNPLPPLSPRPDLIPLGFSDIIQSSPQLIPISGYSFSSNLGIKKEAKSEENLSENGEFVNSGNVDYKDRECSDNEVESRVIEKNRNENSNKLVTRHFRSMSMDSIMGDLHMYDEKSRFDNRIGEKAITNSMDAKLLKFSLEFGNGEFTGTELKKIMANDKLGEIALSDPKRVKRILANRQSAARSKERKTRYISELEIKVHSLQTAATTLSTKLTLLQRETSCLADQNNKLKFRLLALEQQAQLKDALNEALTKEVQRLKTVAVDIRPSMAWLGTTG